MKKTITFVYLCFAAFLLNAQKGGQKGGPYKIKSSVDFESPKKHKVMHPIGYGKEGIIQFNVKGVKSFSFQKFSNELKLLKQNTVKIEDRLNKRVQFQRILKLKNKTYLFVREVFKKTKNEGVTALEFSPKMLNFIGTGKNLFKSSGKVQSGARVTFTYAEPQPSSLGFITSIDKSLFMCSYSLVPRSRRDKVNKEIVGMQVFDEDLNKLWGKEFEMPYTEAIMDNLGFTLSMDGKVYLLTRVFDNEKRKVAKDGKPNYHYEVLVYEEGSKKPSVIEIKLENYFPLSPYIYEDPNHNIVVAGFYSKVASALVDGAFMVKLDVVNESVIKLNGGYYEIPDEVLKSFMSDRQKRKLDKKGEKGKDLGINYLRIRGIYTTANGATKIVSEQYHVVVTYSSNGKTTTTYYDTYAEDIFVMSIDSVGELEWVKKIAKDQHSNDNLGAQLSINAYVVGNDLHIFYIDNIKNHNLKENQAPYRHENRRGGFLTGVLIDPAGEVKKHNLGEIDKYETNFFIRYFVDGESNNLISTERRKKRNMLFSLNINPATAK